VKCNVTFPLPLPDDPRKWDGWNKYKSPNFYERFVSIRARIQVTRSSRNIAASSCAGAKETPLKNQPSNPLAQLLRSGLDESSRYLTEARVELLDPERRLALDNELAAQAQAAAVTEFRKFLTFALADGTLSPETEKNLLQFGAEHGLTNEQNASPYRNGITGGRRETSPIDRGRAPNFRSSRRAVSTARRFHAHDLLPERRRTAIR